MSDTLEPPLATHDTQIDIHDAASCRYWSAYFRVRPKVLKQVVRRVGSRAADVEGYLAQAALHPYIEDDNTEANPT